MNERVEMKERYLVDAYKMKEYERIYSRIQELGLANDPVINNSLKIMSVFSHNKEVFERERARILQIVQAKEIEQQLKGHPFVPEPVGTEVSGEIKLGICKGSNAWFGLSLKPELEEGALVTGRKGSGKTTLCYLLSRGASKLGTHTLTFEVKLEGRNQIANNKDTLVFRCDMTHDWFKYNFLEVPEGVDPLSKISDVSDITEESYEYYVGTSSYIAYHIYELYKRNGIFEGSKNFPTPWDLYWKIEKDRKSLITRDARYRESALNRLNSILLRMGKAFNYKIGYQIEKLLDDCNIVMELDNLGKKGRIFLISLILAQIFRYRISNPNKKHKAILVIIDEANEIYDRRLDEMTGGLTVCSLDRQAREFGICMVYACHDPEGMPRSVINDVHTQILLSLPGGTSLKRMSESMFLDTEQKEYDYQLKPGEGIVRRAGHPHPFLVKFFPHTLPQRIGDEEVQKHMQSLIAELDKNIVTAEKNELFEKGTEKKQEVDECHKENEKTVMDADTEDISLTAEERNYLHDVENRPYISRTTRYKTLGLSLGSGHRIVKKLIEKKLLNTHNVYLSPKGGTTILDSLTTLARELLELASKGISRGGSLLHDFMIWIVSQHLKKMRKDWNVAIERQINGKFCDIVISFPENNTELIALEMETEADSQTIKNNMEKDINQAKCSLVILVLNGKKDTLNKATETLGDYPKEVREKVSFCLLSQIVNCKELRAVVRSKYFEERGL